MKKRIISMLLVTAMLLSLVPAVELAVRAEETQGHLHDVQCGYREAAEAQPCTHEHDESCMVCAHEHDGECGYAEEAPDSSCTHECTDECKTCNHVHDENCGYAEAAEGSPCAMEQQEDNTGFDEDLAAVQTMIDALPEAADVADMDDEERAELEEALNAISGAFDSLTEEQISQLTGVDVLAMLSDALGAYAADTLETGVPYIEYVDGAPTENTCEDYITMDEGTSELENGGWYVVSGDVTIEDRIMAAGTVHLILEDGAALQANMGVNAAQDCTLIIYGQTNNTGRLTAAAEFGAGIGGSFIDGDTNGGTIIIHGGVVTATADNGAGIGGGSSEACDVNGGTVIIHGGTVVAASTCFGAGIGGGVTTSGTAGGGSVTINGGNVTATGGEMAGAGIGGGHSEESSADGGIVTINSGTVSAKGDCGAGIGGGCNASDTESSDGGTVIINGGVVTADGGLYGAGIGGGSTSEGLGTGGDVTINGGTVTAIAQAGAGIGGGQESPGGTVTINGGSVTAYASRTGAPSIGGGSTGSGEPAEAAAITLGEGVALRWGDNDESAKNWVKQGDPDIGITLNHAPFARTDQFSTSDIDYRDTDGNRHGHHRESWNREHKDSTHSSSIPKTGDNSNLLLWAAVTLVGFTAICVGSAYPDDKNGTRKRRRDPAQREAL